MSTQQILILHKFDILFNILNEVKYLLNFKIKQLNEIENNQLEKEKNYLIISGKNLKLENQVIIKEYPISITKFVEIVNVNFLKKKFKEQKYIKIGNYFVNLNSRVMNKGDEKLLLTEKEAKIIIFLGKSKNPTSIVDLQKEVWGHKSKLETHTVETHIYRLRKKIEKKFKDKIFILSYKGGYKVNA